MSVMRYDASMSLDGYVAGPDQGPDHPLGVGGERLHEWMRELAAWRKRAGMEGGIVNASTAVIERPNEPRAGAVIMGRNMFGGGPGPWSEDPWNGWWGDDPPFHLPVFVLTHFAREPLEMRGGTTFFFVTDGIESALDQAKAAAGDKDIGLGGGGTVAAQYLAAGLVDELQIHLVPTLLGAGVRLFDRPIKDGLTLEQTRCIEAPRATHLTYRIRRSG